MDIEESISSDESITRSTKDEKPRVLSTSSDKDFVHAQNDPLVNQEYESTIKEEDSDSDSSSEEDEEDTQWQRIRKRRSIANEYSEEEKLLIENVDCNDPFALFKVFFTDYIAGIIVEETNKYAEQCMNSLSSRRRHQQAWQPVTRGEINTFIGILLIMGVVQLPEIRLHWSKKTMYMNTCIKNSMKRDRFLSILKHLHFSNDTTAETEDRLHKIRSIVEKNFFYDNETKIINLYDQLSSYYSCLRKTVKWYQKIIIQLICGTCLANGWYINQRWGTKYINILQFREQIIDHLLTNVRDIEKMNIEKPAVSNKVSHFLESCKEPARKSRKRCRQCYKWLCETKGRDYAMSKAKRVTTYCNSCKGQPALCLTCFKKIHRKD
ncbi:uncharacterized protein LOC128882588 [Hylaeus volcanicus]|uniref:uncharacterized protein LOC128882588 n=1 Tax=Hylaeus volcanicus TaxID=313075 RepID=UPI0023B7CDEF|nr:uncharacterized protein LOC128882588 [Hylaeus volcanicus]XP_053990209.1 uncharacterized protein LOC128882588 [Hylaeus volcanicus]XP_053990210.1 uncharacterized protein LOC128882588 [Hylaeus volcanicus]